jgi:hypothetical protein
MKLLKKAQMGGLQGFILSIVTIAIVLAIGLIVLAELQTASKVGGVATGQDTNASVATGAIITKLATVPTWIGIIIIVGLAFIVLSFFIGKQQ